MAMGWRVTSQREMDELTPQNTFSKVLVVTYQLDSGTTRSVKVPINLATADYVQDLIMKDAQHAYGIDNLSA